MVWHAEHVPITSRIQPCSRYAIIFPTLYLKEGYNKHIAESCVSRTDEWTVTESHSIAVAYEVPTAAALNAAIASRSCETADSVARRPRCRGATARRPGNETPPRTLHRTCASADAPALPFRRCDGLIAAFIFEF